MYVKNLPPVQTDYNKLETDIKRRRWEWDSLPGVARLMGSRSPLPLGRAICHRPEMWKCRIQLTA
ncbi:MAG: hypothetical protein IID45_09580 [Planctomycetes bacterium]|nr:hypothetical protein [Planctomycetota bacterium]